MDTSNDIGSTQDVADRTQTAQGNPQSASPSTSPAQDLAVDFDATYTNPAAQRAVADAVATGQPISLSGPVCYTMQPGQTVQDVATAFGTTVRDLAVANGITNLDTVYPGQTLNIPGPQDKPEIGSLSAQYENRWPRPWHGVHRARRYWRCFLRQLPVVHGCRPAAGFPGHRGRAMGR